MAQHWLDVTRYADSSGFANDIVATLKSLQTNDTNIGVLANLVVTTGDFTVDLAAKRVTRAGGEDVRLTPTEWQLLEVLVRNAGRLVTQRQLLQEVWGPAYETESNYLRVYIAQLRRKLEPEPARPRYLHTEPGMGYRFQP